MSRWDLLTWFSVVILTVGSILVLAFFLRDLGGILKGGDRPRDRD
jgi:hypothetical protein